MPPPPNPYRPGDFPRYVAWEVFVEPGYWEMMPDNGAPWDYTPVAGQALTAFDMDMSGDVPINAAIERLELSGWQLDDEASTPRLLLFWRASRFGKRKPASLRSKGDRVNVQDIAQILGIA